MKWASVVVLAALLIVPVVAMSAAREALLLDESFDSGSLIGWRTSGDLCVAPAFCAGAPSGKYWVAMSTNNPESDAMTLCGYSSLGGLQSTLRSPDLPLPFQPSRIRVEFKVKFLTNETPATDLGNDAFTARLLTMAGPVMLASLDDSGAAPESKNFRVSGDATFRESDCSTNWRYETGMLEIVYDRTFRLSDRKRMAEGPMAIEFSLANQFDMDFDSAVVLDDVRIRIFR